jgi:hypothetical protein
MMPANSRKRRPKTPRGKTEHRMEKSSKLKIPPKMIKERKQREERRRILRKELQIITTIRISHNTSKAAFNKLGFQMPSL